MRILILNWRDIKHPRAGGADMRLQEVYAPLVKQGHEVILFSCGFADCAKHDVIDGIQVHRLGNDFTFSFLCLFRLRGWVKKYKPDVVVEDLNKLPFYSPLVYRGPLLIQMHHLWRGSIFKETFFPLALFVWVQEALIPWVYKRCQFSVVSLSTKEELVDMGIVEEHIEVVYNGADLELYTPVETPKEPFILWVSRLQKYKRPTDAVEVLERLSAEFPGLKLVVVGDGPFRSELERFIAKRGLEDKVVLTGFISGETKIRLFQQASVHLQSSYKEGWGLSVIEANACGCPVVANDTAGLRDSCRDQETGLLYKYGDIDDATSKVRLVLMDMGVRNKVVKQGLDWARTFSWKRNSEEMMGLLEKIVDKHRR